jgi:AcrR family transcriptional regulator
MMPVPKSKPNQSPIDRILSATVEIIRKDGLEAATTRAVALAAGVQAPAIYRMFADKDGLLEAAAGYAMEAYVREKSKIQEDADPVEALRAGWDRHLEFALTHRGIYRTILAKDVIDQTAASRRGLDILRAKMEAVAASGRLRMPPAEATDLFHALATGTVVTLLGREQNSEGSLWRNAREAALAAIVTDSAAPAEPDAPSVNARRTYAIALQSLLSEAVDLSPGERLLLSELLGRISGR